MAKPPPSAPTQQPKQEQPSHSAAGSSRDRQRSPEQRADDGDRLHWLKDADYQPPAQQQQTPPPRERSKPPARRPKSQPSPARVPAGQDSTLKKYWWVAALVGGGVLVLAAVSK